MSNKQSGIITLEILIALAIITMVISAVILVVLGNQKISTDTLTNNEALLLVQARLEKAQADAHTSFSSVISDPSPVPNGIYNQQNTVTDISDCLKELITKLTWNMEGRALSTELSTMLGSPETAYLLGGDCITDPSEGGWTHPATLLSRDLNYHAAYSDTDTPKPDSDNGTKATGIDVLNKIIYMTASSTSNKDTFFIFDASDVFNETIPPITGSLNTGSALNDLDVVHDSSSGETYAYVTGYYENPAGAPCGGGIPHKPYSNQLQVIRVTDINNPTLVISKNLSTVSSCGQFPAGFSIYYFDKKLYVGTKETSGSELTIFDLSGSLTNPNEIANIAVNRNVNAILVKDKVAYLATGPGAGLKNPLKKYDVDPASPTYKQQIGSFTATGNEQGTSLFLLGGKLYLGLERATGARPDFYILNPSTLAIVKQKNLVLNPGSAVTDIFVSGKYAFITISDPNFGFGVLDNPSLGTVSKYDYSQDATGIDFENGFIYTSNQRNDALRIIRPSECSDKIDDDGDGKIDISDAQCHSDGNANNTASYDPEDDSE